MDRRILDEFAATSSEWLWETDGRLRLTYLSQNFGLRAGVDPELWLGRDLPAILSDGPRPAAETPLAQRQPFRNWIVRYRDRRGMDRLAALSGTPNRDARGRFRGYRGTGRGHTSTAGAAERNAQAHELLLGAMESISEGFALYDSEDRLVLYNTNYRFFKDAEFTAIFPGAQFEDIVRAAVARGYYPAAEGRVEAWIEERVGYHRNPTGVFEAQLCDGRWLQIVERRTPSGGTVTVNTDITSKKRRDEAQQEAQKLQALGQLTGGVAHDFSNVLLVLECNLDLIEEALRTNAQPWPHIAGCHSAIKLANGLTQRLLAFARRQPLQPRVIDVNELVLGMQDFLRRALRDDIEIEVALSSRVWRVLADPNQLETTILNLSLNARDAMPAGGKLVLKTANAYLGPEWAARQPDLRPGSYVVIAVADNGTGMSKDVSSRAVEPFFTTKEGGKGSGLGLSMSYGFIKQSGGHLEIDSAPGVGTAVQLILPRVDVGEPARLPGAAAALRSPLGRNETILLVEPGRRAGSALAGTLTALGYNVLCARSGKEAFALMNEVEVMDLLVADLALAGGMDGTDVVRELARRKPDLKILLMSGHAERSVDADWPTAHRADHLRRPFRQAELAHVVGSILNDA